MRVANKLTPETKNKTTKPGHGLGKKIKSRPSSSLFQKARGSGATLKTLKSPHRVVYVAQTGARQAFNRSRKFVKTTDYTELFTWQRRRPTLNRSREVVSTRITCNVVHMAKSKARQSTRQVK